MLDCFLNLLERFQTLVVGVVGFASVIWTIAANARHTRQQHEHEIEHEGDMLRLALRSELGIIRDAFKDRINTLTNARTDSRSTLVPLDTMSDAYSQLLNKVGLLSEDEVKTTMEAYLLVRQMPERLRLLENSHGTRNEREMEFAEVGRDLFTVLQEMHRGYLEKIEAALVALSRPDS